jgi:curved DNA-binding protein CbpA
VNYYEILGLPRDASSDEIHHAYSAKATQLLPARAEGAPPNVIEAVNKARAVIDDAGRILGDAVLRSEYDFAIDRAAESGSSAESVSRLHDDQTSSGLAGPRMSRSQEWFTSPLGDAYAGLEELAEWLGPHSPRGPRMVTVPDLRGIEAGEAFYVVAKAELHINFVHMTESQEGEGLVISQDPPAGVSVRRHSTLTVEVVYSGTPT